MVVGERQLEQVGLRLVPQSYDIGLNAEVVNHNILQGWGQILFKGFKPKFKSFEIFHIEIKFKSFLFQKDLSYIVSSKV